MRSAWCLANVAARAILTALALGACHDDAASRSPTEPVVPADPPGPERGDRAAFLAAGCVAQHDLLECGGVPSLHAAGCEDLRVDDDLAGLRPKRVIGECLIHPANHHGRGPVREGHCPPRPRIEYAIQEGDGFRMLESADALAAEFAPIESAEEAVAFAVAMTGAHPRWDVSHLDGYRAVIPNVEPTRPVATADGFALRLFDEGGCGCSFHPLDAVDLEVTRAGALRVIARKKAFDGTTLVCRD